MDQARRRDAAELMTLAAVASVRAGANRGFVQAGIDDQLQQRHYATGGVWRRVWGPTLSRENAPPLNASGLAMYVARRDDPKGVHFVIAVRAPRWSFLAHIGAAEWLEAVPLAGAPAGARAARGAVRAQQQLLAMSDPRRGPLLRFLRRELPKHENWSLSLAAHGLAGPVVELLRWALDEELGEVLAAGRVETWTFGGPSVGNAELARRGAERFGDTVFRVVNPFDAVPYVWARLGPLSQLGIPNSLPTRDERGADPIDIERVVAEVVDRLGAQEPVVEVGRRLELRGVQIPSQRQSPQGEPWLAQVDFQHNPNSYLWLLEAEEVFDRGVEGPYSDASVLPHFATTQPLRTLDSDDL